MSDLLIHNGKLFEEIKNGVFEGVVPAAVPVKYIQTPTMKWVGKKIPYDLFRQIVSFFRFVYNRDKDECQIRLFYSDEHGWAADTLPQRGIGMTTKEIDDHEARGPIIQEWLERGYSPCGNMHHHCSSSAFQSGTDEADEIKAGSGLFWTIGHMDKPTIDIHVRIVFRGHQYSASAEDLIETPDIEVTIPGLETMIPAMRKHLILNPAPMDFPELWLDRIIKFQSTYGGTQLGFSHTPKATTFFPGASAAAASSPRRKLHEEASIICSRAESAIRFIAANKKDGDEVAKALDDIRSMFMVHGCYTVAQVDAAALLFVMGLTGPDVERVSGMNETPAAPAAPVEESNESGYGMD